MNILFYLHGECCPDAGGIERVTDILVRNFVERYHYNCFCIYQEKVDDSLRRTNFKGCYYLPSNDSKKIADIIESQKIDIIINQEEHYVTSQIYDAVKLSGQDCKIVFCYHNTPMKGATASIAFSRIFNQANKNFNIKSWIKVILYPIYRCYILNIIKRQYRDTLKKSDINLMLSDCFIESWYLATGIKKKDRPNYAKVSSMPNPLSFENDITRKGGFSGKEKRVLIVSRLYEPQKRILLALKIWRRLENDSKYNDWYLDIVGDGPDRKLYEIYTKKYLKRVTFYGRRSPADFYKRSSLFLMTSAYEGWPMTLAEANSFGCLPIVFDSFGALQDMLPSVAWICKIQDRNSKEFLTVLKRLMSDVSLRSYLALQCVEYVSRFSQINITSRWNKLFKELKN